MSTPSEAVREIVYSRVAGDPARRELCSPRAGAFLSRAALSCLPAVRALGAGEEADSALVKVLLHYALSAAAMPSHRAVSVRGREFDIVLPDARTLASDPRRAMVICVPASARGAARAAESASSALPRANVAVAVCPSAAGLGVEAYSVEDGTLGGVLGRAREFLSSSGAARLGVLASPVQAKERGDVHGRGERAGGLGGAGDAAQGR